MSEEGMRLTRQGKILLAKALTGKELKFLHVEIGDGEFDYETESVMDLTELRSKKMELPLTRAEVIGDGTCFIQSHLSNAENYVGFCAREFGLFAQDPDDGSTVLYSYRNSGDEYDFIPSNIGSSHKNLFIEFIIEIQDAENVTAVLDLSLAYISEEAFRVHINSAHPHPNTPNYYGSVTTTRFIWVTDEDSNLYKMSVGNMKALLREDTADDDLDEPGEEVVLSEADRINNAKAELGLSANMLIAEDLTKPDQIDTLDTFKTKVTSSAENGLLLGVESVDGLKTGSIYTISDGVNQELVKISSIVYDISGVHLRLAERLSNSYDWGSTFIFRTAYSGAEKAALIWTPNGGFAGVSANIARTITLNTSVEKAQNFDITGDGYLTVDGYFALGA